MINRIFVLGFSLSSETIAKVDSRISSDGHGSFKWALFGRKGIDHDQIGLGPVTRPVKAGSKTRQTKKVPGESSSIFSVKNKKTMTLVVTFTSLYALVTNDYT